MICSFEDSFRQFVEIWNEHPVVDVNNAFVTCCLHANNSVHCLQSVTANKIQVAFSYGFVSLVRKRGHCFCFNTGATKSSVRKYTAGVVHPTAE